jgi:hypothetical protein
VRRRLNAAFPNIDTTAARYLGRTTGGQRRDKRFLLAGLADSPALQRWIDWLGACRNPVKPLALLPLEAVTLATGLSGTLHAAEDLPRWIMLVTRQRTGGFRQVVVHDGEFVFTRLTPALAPDASGDDVARAVEHEFRLSMGYLRRMSFGDNQGLDLIVIAAPDVGEAMLETDLPEDQLTVMTPDDAAERIGLAGFAELNDEGFGEPLHAAAFGQRRRPAMSLLPPRLKEKRVGALAVAGAYAAIALIVGYLSFNLSDAYLEAQDIAEAYDQASIQTLQREARLDAVLDETGAFEVSGPEVADTIALYDRLSAEAPTPLPLLAMVGPSLGPYIVIHRIDWQVAGNGTGRNITLSLTIHIEPAAGDMSAAVAVADDFAARLADQFPGLDVRVTDPPIDILPEQYLSGEVNLDDEAGDGVDVGYEAVITVMLPDNWPVEPSS